MSFRARLISFFVVIVVLPMIAIGVLVYRLIGDSEQGKADARAGGLLSAAVALYDEESVAGRSEAATFAHDSALFDGRQAATRLSAVANRAGLARITVTAGSRVVADVGDPTAIAPGIVVARFRSGARAVTLAVSELTAARFARELTSAGDGLVVSQGSRTLASSVPHTSVDDLPRSGDLRVDGEPYRAANASFRGFGRSRVNVTVLSAVSATAGSTTSTEVVAVAFIAVFCLLALAFSLLASRALQGQVGGFLQAARRLAGGDFSSRIRVDGRDEFAALGEEFNHMSDELARRVEELSHERARLREAIHRIGQTFASNLDRGALLELALKTAIDAARADGARVSDREHGEERFAERAREGSLEGLEGAAYAAERGAIATGRLAEFSEGDGHVIAVPLGTATPDRGAPGVVAVGRRCRAFSDDERELLRSLAVQAGLALENVDLHYQVRRQAVTDELTGLSNHRHFQELLRAEFEQVRRYHQPVGLIMLDIDNFKSVNDTYGHQQGDDVLKAVARVVQENSRDADTAARYGGEEMALILPHTGLDGAYVIAERMRDAIAALRVPRTEGNGVLRTTASLGVAAATDGEPAALIADADAALYDAKRQGKNRTVKGAMRAANALSAE